MLFTREQWCCIKATCFLFLAPACKNKTALTIYSKSPRRTTRAWPQRMRLQHTHRPGPLTPEPHVVGSPSERRKPSPPEHHRGLSHNSGLGDSTQGHSSNPGPLLSSSCAQARGNRTLPGPRKHMETQTWASKLMIQVQVTQCTPKTKLSK